MLRLGSIARTTIDVDISFFILVVFFVATYYDPNRGIHYALLWIPVLFLSILIHELAHAAAFGIFGYGPSRIVLGGIGGVTMNESNRRTRPWHDLLISAAGPLASFGIYFAVLGLFYNVPYTRQDPALAAFLPLLGLVNRAWGFFNLIPVNPLDGGHVVRSFFRMFLSERLAFIIAVWIAIIAGVGVVVWALIARYIFAAVLIGWYVFMNFQAWQHFRETGVPGD